MSTPKTVGIILAGGLSRRMGGGDKALLPVAGKQILARVIERLGSQCAGLVLNANGDPARFAAFGLPVTPDSVPDFAGPLAGILAGMDFVAEHRPGVEWIVSAAADTPFLPTDLVARLHAARLERGTALACAGSGGQQHHVNAIWPVVLRDDLRAALDGGLRKVQIWTGKYGVAVAEWPDSPVDPFFNANTPEDLREADRLAAGD